MHSIEQQMLKRPKTDTRLTAQLVSTLHAQLLYENWTEMHFQTTLHIWRWKVPMVAGTMPKTTN